MLISLIVEFALQRKGIHILHNKVYAIDYKWNISVIVSFFQFSVGNVHQKKSCFHLSLFFPFICLFSFFGSPSSHKKRSRSCFVFLPLLLLFAFPLSCFSLPCPDMLAKLLIRFSSSALALKHFKVIFCSTLMSFNFKMYRACW